MEGPDPLAEVGGPEQNLLTGFLARQRRVDVERRGVDGRLGPGEREGRARGIPGQDGGTPGLELRVRDTLGDQAPLRGFGRRETFWWSARAAGHGRGRPPQ